MTKFWICFILTMMSLSSQAIEITRYVAQGGAGDGLSKENPTGDLKKVLDLSTNVEALTIYLEPGTYTLPTLEGANRTVYNNVCIYGGGCDKVIDAPQKSIIKGDLYINGGAVLNVDFRGSVYEDKWSPNVVHGALSVIGCNVIYTKATRFTAEAVGNREMFLIGVKANTVEISAYSFGRGTPLVTAWGCDFSDGEGVSINGVMLMATDCSFNNHTGAPGLSLNLAEGSVIRDCRIIGNKGCGGIELGGLTDNIVVMFDRCVISNNVTNKHNYSSVITTRTPFYMRSCLIANNSADVKGAGVGYDKDHCEGAILLTRQQTGFMNCTFYGNREALIQYKMEPADHHNLGHDQFKNCVFLNNEKPYLSKSGLYPTISYSAADFGSDIPELDAEKHMKRITAENCGMVVNEGISVRLTLGSPLINAGLPTYNLDINGNSHQLLGATDLGCCEYTGEWVKSTPESSIKIYNANYTKVQTRYDNTDYYAMVTESHLDGDKVTSFEKSIYAGNQLQPIAKIGDGSVIACMRADNKNIAIIYQLECSPWGKWEIWVPDTMKEYATVAPLAEYVNHKWVLKDAPQQGATSRKTSSTARKSQKSATKRPSSRK